jgi:acylphosphatase
MAATTSKAQGHDPNLMRRLRLHFVGEVQGVGFRWTAHRVANELGLVGWVRNEPDGSVSMELQGPSHDLAVYFTLFDRQYASYPIRYVIDEKDDIALVQGEKDLRVRF